MPMHANDGNSPGELLTNKEAAAFLRVAPETLAQWRYNRKFDADLPYQKIGRLVMYYRHHLVAFVASRTIGGKRDQQLLANQAT